MRKKKLLFSPDDVRVLALQRAVKIAGGQAALARQVGISPQGLWWWEICPAERCLQVSRLTGISVHELRPEVFGDPPMGEAKRKREISDMITHIKREERELLERIIQVIDDTPFPVLGPAITHLFAFVHIAAYEQRPEADVMKVFESSADNARRTLEAFVEDHKAKAN